MPDMTLAHAAQVFQEMAFHTIPTRAEDKALALRAGQRRIYERRCPTAQEVHAWWTQDPGYNVALLLGPACRLLVLNVNQKHGFDGLGTLKRKGHVIRDDVTPTILTPHGGAAYCFKPPDREQFPFLFKTHIRVPEYPGIELRGTGGYQLVPPSSVKATARDPAGDYRFAMPWTLTALVTECPDLPDWLLELWSACDRQPPRPDLSSPTTAQTTSFSSRTSPPRPDAGTPTGDTPHTAGHPPSRRQETGTTEDGRVIGCARAYYCAKC